MGEYPQIGPRLKHAQIIGETQIVDVFAGTCVTIPLGTHFQFRCLGDEPLQAIGVTMPPWPGEDEAILVPGAWKPTVP